MAGLSARPKATTEPGDLKRSIETKYGPGAFDQMTRRLDALGQAEGIDYRFDLAKRVNTIDAHRLLAWSLATDGPAVQAALVEVLFRAYFQEGANVADHATLAGAATEVGLDGDAATAMLAGGDHLVTVEADLAQASEHGIAGVPAFVLDETFVIPGAQDTDTFVNLIGRVLDRA